MSDSPRPDGDVRIDMENVEQSPTPPGTADSQSNASSGLESPAMIAPQKTQLPSPSPDVSSRPGTDTPDASKVLFRTGLSTQQSLRGNVSLIWQDLEVTVPPPKQSLYERANGKEPGPSKQILKKGKGRVRVTLLLLPFSLSRRRYRRVCFFLFVSEKRCPC